MVHDYSHPARYDAYVSGGGTYWRNCRNLEKGNGDGNKSGVVFKYQKLGWAVTMTEKCISSYREEVIFSYHQQLMIEDDVSLLIIMIWDNYPLSLTSSIICHIQPLNDHDDNNDRIQHIC